MLILDVYEGFYNKNKEKLERKVKIDLIYTQIESITSQLYFVSF